MLPGAARDVLGAFSSVRLGRIQTEVNPGDRFYFYSDGLVDSACTSSGRSACVDKLVAVCAQAADAPITSAPKQIVQEMLVDSASVCDDLVVLGVEV